MVEYRAACDWLVELAQERQGADGRLRQGHRRVRAADIGRCVRATSSSSSACSPALIRYDAPLDVCNPLGNLHGGCSATLIDEISTLALQALDKARRQGVSVSLTTDYLAAAPHGATVLIEGRCHKVGRTLAFTSAEIRDKHSGRVYVRGSHVKFVGVARL